MPRSVVAREERSQALQPRHDHRVTTMVRRIGRPEEVAAAFSRCARCSRSGGSAVAPSSLKICAIRAAHFGASSFGIDLSRPAPLNELMDLTLRLAQPGKRDQRRVAVAFEVKRLGQEFLIAKLRGGPPFNRRNPPTFRQGLAPASTILQASSLDLLFGRPTLSSATTQSTINDALACRTTSRTRSRRYPPIRRA